MFLEEDFGKNRNTKKGNKSFESKFKYLKKIINRNCLHEKLSSRLNSGNIFYHLVHNYFSKFPIKNFNFKVYRTIILPVVLYGCETLSLAIRKEHRPRLRVPKNSMQSKIFGPKRK
jgi:hypothetical protein